MSLVSEEMLAADAALAHALKQPLAVASGYLELLLTDDPRVRATPTALDYVRQAQAALRHLERVVATLEPPRTR